jgi:hypothetical protein
MLLALQDRELFCIEKVFLHFYLKKKTFIFIFNKKRGKNHTQSHRTFLCVAILLHTVTKVTVRQATWVERQHSDTYEDRTHQPRISGVQVVHRGTGIKPKRAVILKLKINQ